MLFDTKAGIEAAERVLAFFYLSAILCLVWGPSSSLTFLLKLSFYYASDVEGLVLSRYYLLTVFDADY